MTITYANQQIRVIVIRKASNLSMVVFPDNVSHDIACSPVFRHKLAELISSVNHTESKLKTKRVQPAYN